MERYKQLSDSSVRFEKTAFGEPECSTMLSSPLTLTTFNAGDIIPLRCFEVLPDDHFEIDLDAVVRQTTLLTPTMGSMYLDVYAFFVPNRVVNESWKTVEGENINGSWTAPDITLAPLKTGTTGSTQVPVGSVADYYGFPTQKPLPNALLALCHDLKFRGYVSIYNEYFRDQNYQPPIPMSLLNVYQGFFEPRNYFLGSVDAIPSQGSPSGNPSPDGSFGFGSISQSLFGSSAIAYPNNASPDATIVHDRVVLSDRFYALGSPLKANKLHDYFTSTLPSPYKGAQILIPTDGVLNLPSLEVITSSTSHNVPINTPVSILNASGSGSAGYHALYMYQTGANGIGTMVGSASDSSITNRFTAIPNNLVTRPGSTPASPGSLGISVSDLRMSAAIQQVYETLARGGSRYREFLRSFFGLDVQDPFTDIPQYVGHIRKELDLYQTAQTSPSESGSTPQGNLAAFGYTTLSDTHLTTFDAVEHGYLHILCVARHRNIYGSYMSRDNFRMQKLDYYMPPLANISEQPVYTREINPFAPNPNSVFGYQEAWAEYRYDPDIVTGYMRPGIEQSLSLWNYSDDFNSSLIINDGNWLKSNSEEVLNRSLAVTSAVAPQFKGEFKMNIVKTRPMPVDSVPGMDII
ncbi:major capsid protein [Dipodfec virus UOA04_Rod_734]|nr:major capsid protein [Dipodfec virus UOA04_Rod_734]